MRRPSIVYSYILYSFVAAERDGAANRLAFVFAVTAFSTVLGMIVVQLAVGAGIGEITKGLDEATTQALRRGPRMIDLGLDVAWDMLIGTAPILSGAAMRRRSGLGPAWAMPSVILGVSLIVLNAATFPWPPGDRGGAEMSDGEAIWGRKSDDEILAAAASLDEYTEEGCRIF